MFSRRPKSSAASEADAPDAEQSPSGKGRPTPTRKEAELARKQALRTPSNPRAARRAAREQARKTRMQNRAALMAGDEKGLPTRDQGPVRRYVRDFVDSRFTLAEYFIFIALIVLAVGFIPNQTVSSIVSLAWFALIAIIIFDSFFIGFKLNRQLKAAFPEKAERKGAIFYAIMRTLQLRRLRLPPPRVKRGQIPEPPRSSSKGT
jgi:hypothetical protein